MAMENPFHLGPTSGARCSGCHRCLYERRVAARAIGKLTSNASKLAFLFAGPLAPTYIHAVGFPPLALSRLSVDVKGKGVADESDARCLIDGERRHAECRHAAPSDDRF